MNTVAKIKKTDTQTSAISLPNIPLASHAGCRVVTTELLARLYGTDPVRIRQNHKRNIDRFIDGKHFFKINGKDVDDLRVSLSDSQISPKTRSLILWTERGAARHAKMLETDQAWDVFEKLEDCYFNVKAEIEKQAKPRQSSVDERTPLRQYVEKMIANKKGMIYPDIWKLVHDRFDVTHINQLTGAESLEAVEYLKAMEGEFLGTENKPSELDLQMHVHNINAACIHMDFIHRVWKDDLYPALRNLESPLASKLYDRIVDACFIVHSVRRGLEMASGLQGIQYKH